MTSHLQVNSALASQSALADSDHHSVRKARSSLSTQEQSFRSKLEDARQKTVEPLPISERAFLLFKGLWLFPTLFIAATAYWSFFLWDFKNYEKRTSHYKLKLHNTWMTYFRPTSVAQWADWRQKECDHCGACCEILWRCPFLSTDQDGTSHCTVHAKRPLPCRTFPIDPESVELISKKRTLERSCSYRFAVLIDNLIEEQKTEEELIPNAGDIPLVEPTSSSHDSISS